MSASLVGSEMCIRDRDFRMPRTATDFKATLASAATRRGKWLAGNNARAVSYTHLTLPTICSV
eukprot:15095197-Alexandrium_andersonii.AAC.1